MSAAGGTARCLMVQGTASHVGKSIVTAGLCRLFSDLGWRVAPFKSQNMSLNSCVTARRRGDRPGPGTAGARGADRAAGGDEPRAAQTEGGDEVRGDPARASRAAAGRPWSTSAYTSRKPCAWCAESLDELRRDFDLVVIEGAGSPAEINLRRRDICNMKVAAMAEAPVLLLADIDKGGALASVVGTMELLRAGGAGPGGRHRLQQVPRRLRTAPPGAPHRRAEDRREGGRGATLARLLLPGRGGHPPLTPATRGRRWRWCAFPTCPTSPTSLPWPVWSP